MTHAQKIIKYFAIAFAIFLIIAIIGGIVRGISFAVNVFGDNDTVSVADLKDYKLKDVNKLYVDIDAADIKVVCGESFSLKSNHENLKVEEYAGKLSITDSNQSWDIFDKKYQVEITIPENANLETVTLDAGAGKVLLENFKTEELNLILGAGEVKLNKLDVTAKTEIEGGAGEITATDCSFANLDMEIGVGECNLTAWALGDSQIECGVGEANLTFFKDTDNDYTVSVSKGLGSVEVDGRSVGDEEKVGNGKNRLDIDCGVGAVDIKFENK